ncbi:MAG: ATP phosphoribosyltransferase regulatory subunit, partial [Burkholderiales bacterium]
MRTWVLPEYIEDILPPEAERIERLRRDLLDLFREQRYELVMPPLLEYTDSLLTGTGHDLDLQTFKLVDQLSGRMMGLRADMTPQVARIAASRLKKAPRPLRLCYGGQVLQVRGSQLRPERQFAQAGIELIGAEAPVGTVDVLEVLCAALDAGGLPRARIGLGDAGLFGGLLKAMGVNTGEGQAAMEALGRHDLVDLEQRVDRLSIAPEQKRTLVSLPQLRGGAEVIERAMELGGEDVSGPF